MTFDRDIAKSIINRTAVAALTVLISMSSAQVVSAQDASALSQGDDALLPPEVVPLDPSTAGSIGRAQAASTPSTTGNAVPGLVDNNAAGNMQSAQDFRKAAFNSLYNQGQVPQQQPFPGQWRAGQLNPAQAAAQGQSPMDSQDTTSMANNPPTQSQTLTGGTKYQQKLQNTHRGGFSNVLSAAGAFGAGAMLGGFFIRPNNPMMQAGIWGLTTTGFGTRNAFRF
jgi:hypothetical protein